jgi:predicted Zn-dependent protease
VIPFWEEVIRRSPRDPDIGIRYMMIGIVHLLQSRTDEAIVWLETARAAVPAHPSPCSLLAAAYALKGETDRAITELAEARRLCGDDRYASIAPLRSSRLRGVPKILAL